MEEIHRGAVNLCTLRLEDVGFIIYDSPVTVIGSEDGELKLLNKDGVGTIISAADTNFEDIVIVLVDSMRFVDYDDQNKTFTNWLKYIRKKYVNTLSYSITYTDKLEGHRGLPEHEQYVEDTLSSMTKVACYKMALFPVTDGIIKTIDNNINDIKLKDLTICFDKNKDISQQTKLLLASRQKDTIQNLPICDTTSCAEYDSDWSEIPYPSAYSTTLLELLQH